MLTKTISTKWIHGGQWYDFLDLFGSNPDTFILDHISGDVVPANLVVGLSFFDGSPTLLAELSAPNGQSSVPLPSSLLLFLIGLPSLLVARWHVRRQDLPKYAVRKGH